mmetsp:Transcript_12206/g.24776  ORF Transcript_12206/g.24776 Transcript_12206/m.24776 type:complete len:281 (-) Transcript_12206:260-1102(-)
MQDPPVTHVMATMKALIFTKMVDYQHSSTPAAAAWLLAAVTERGWKGVVSDDSSILEDGSTLEFDIIILVNNSGAIFDPASQVLKKHLEAGRSVLGIHAALATFLDGEDASGLTHMKPTTPIIQETFRAHFKNHPVVQEATVVIDHELADAFSPNLASLPEKFSHTDEFFNFTSNPCDDPEVKVLAYVDETTYEGGLMGAKHPMCWYLNTGPNNAKVFYCAMGHFSHFYNGLGVDVVQSLLGAGLDYCGALPPGAAPSSNLGSSLAGDPTERNKRAKVST